ncbi:MAG: SusC/RagA family TonB-linked outer membrane protein [Bacteroidetes bacterium]|nr:SusC/RagA family TonB-linked outer membrane protein [Bacteroidota bacterium]
MKKFLLMCFSFGFVLSVWAQDRVVTGKLTSKDDGSALPGVNVVLKGTTNGTVTDSEGNYKIAVPAGATLVFSFIGMETQEVAVGERAILDVSLSSDVKQLSEVVVTIAGGLQARERELGAATTVVNSQTLTAGKSFNLAGGLQGKVAGFQINATSSGVNPSYRLILRGQRSITGDNQALIVLDGVIVPSDVLSNLNPNDIENVNILQGAGAAALYGSQASNGAMIITTKKGRSGSTEITASQNVQFNQVAFFPKFQTKFGAGGSAYGVNPDGSPFFNYLENQSYGPAFDGVDRPLGPPQENGYQDHTTYNYKNGHEKFWNIGQSNITDVSFSTGDDKSTLMVSGQYVTTTGTTPGDKFTRGNLRVNGTRKIGEKVKVAYTMLYAPNIYDISSATNVIYDNMLNMPQNVDITKYKNWRNTGFGPDAIGSPNNFYNPWYQNPYFTADNYREKDKNNYLTGNIEIKFTPIKGLELTAREGITSREYFQKSTVGAYTYSDYAKNTDQSSKTDIPASVSESTMWSIQSITDFLAQYNKSFSDFHINVVGGVQMKSNQAKYMFTSIGGLVVPNLYNLSNGTGNPSYGEADFTTHLFGAYGKATISYKDIYFLTGTARNDWDSRLNANNRSFFYPSVEGVVVLSDAIPSIKDNNFVNYVKLRANVSKVGKVNLGSTFNGFTDFGAYYTLPTFSSNVSYATGNGFPYGALAGYSLSNGLVSKNLTPEFSNTFEVGTDFSLWRDKINGSVTYYNTKTNNQTISTAISNSTGFSSLLTNVGETQNTGLEVTLHVTPIKTNDWTVTVGGNFTYQQNQVNYISALLPQLNLATSGTAISAAVAGKSFPVIMGYDYVRDPKGHVIVDGVTGLPSQTSGISILGNATPKNIIGTDAKISYKAFSFSILFEYRGGYKVFNGVGPNMDWSGTSFRTAVYDRKSFVFPNSVILQSDGTYATNKSVMIANGNGNNGFWSDGINRNVTSNYVTSGNFIKLREISLGYDLTPVISKLGSKFIKGGSISVQGRNLFLWMAKDNYYTDPEYSTAGATGNGTGLNDVGQTPPVRYFGGTFQLRF